MKLNPAKTLLALFVLTTAAFAADQFQIDPVHSSANFTVRHMMISNVNGRFTDISGTITYDDADVTKSSVTAVIKTASVNTDNSGRDKDLRSARFFDVDKYPEMTFNSKRIEKRGGQLVAIGTLTIKNVSKEVEVPFEISKGKTPMGVRVGVSAALKINRQDFGVSFNATLDGGGLVVSDDVKIELNVEGVIPQLKK